VIENDLEMAMRISLCPPTIKLCLTKVAITAISPMGHPVLCLLVEVKRDTQFESSFATHNRKLNFLYDSQRTHRDESWEELEGNYVRCLRSCIRH
jgi:hypothetical protein